MNSTVSAAPAFPAAVVKLIREARFFALRYETFITPVGDLADITDEEVGVFAPAGVMITPWHEQARGAAEALRTGRVVALDGGWELQLGPGFTRKLSLLLCAERPRAPVIFLRVEGCFLGRPTVYATPDLPRDTIVYALAVASVLRAGGGRTDQWVVAIDWECCAAVLALRERHRTLLQLQYPVDQWLGHALEGFDFPAGETLRRCTALTAGLHAADVVTGASRGFCEALRAEPVYQHVLARHLRPELARIVALDNANLDALSAAECALADELASDRHHAGMVIAADIAARRVTYLGDERRRFHGAPLILCGGNNTTQQGWEVAIACVRRLLGTNPKFGAAFWFVMLDGDEGASRRLAEIDQLRHDFPDAVVRTEGSPVELKRLLAVADFNLRPSLFEPFGRCYSHAVIPISSATDGPGSQIPPRNRHGRAPAGWTVPAKLAQTDEATVSDWTELISGQPVAETNATFRALVNRYCEALVEAVRVRSQDPIGFAAMVCSALNIQRKRSWVQSYQRMIDLMEGPGAAAA